MRRPPAIITLPVPTAANSQNSEENYLRRKNLVRTPRDSIAPQTVCMRKVIYPELWSEEIVKI